MSQSADAGPVRVVILGGGAAGVAAAYWLSRPEQNGKYRITLYSQGWRLGGKCASGRNAEAGERIEEHGLHMLMGCYQNAFSTLRACYLDWRTLKPNPQSPFQSWTDAFLPQRLISLMEQDGPGDPPSWSPWNFPCPQLPGEPGDGPLVPGSDSTAPDASDQAMIIRLTQWLEDNTPVSAPYQPALADAFSKVRGLFISDAPNTAGAQSALADAAGQIHTSQAGGSPAAASYPQWLGRLAILADIGVAVCVGFLRDIWLKGPTAWDALNTQDFRAWLGGCGASPKALAAAPINAFYDLTFAEVGGVSEKPAGGSGSLAAGVSLRAQMEIALGYRNAPLFKMAAGMGDTVFTPFWDVLTARGVDVRLFSRVSAVTPTAGDALVSQVQILTQAVTVDGTPYRPLRKVKNLDCWPNLPDWNQLQDGPHLKEQGVNFEYSGCDVHVGEPTVLLAGQDFDIVILAMPPQALQRAASGLEADATWAAAIGASASVCTRSLQLWMTQTVQCLGWTEGPTVLTSFVEPYDSWGDMSQVLGVEDWPGPTVPKSVGYFCGCMPYWIVLPVDPHEIHAAAVAAADAWLTPNIATLWPNIGPDPVSAPFSRHDVANFDLSETYVQTPAGNNVASRLDPATAFPFSNLYTVGDWTRTRFSGGCFESAIESAMLASRAISGFPPYVKTS